MANKSKSKSTKPKKSEKEKASLSFTVLENMDGNPQSPAEFDEEPKAEGEYYFNAEDDASEEQKNRCLILNYIHQRLRVAMPRTIPANSNIDNDSFEVLHAETFEGKDLQVCIHYPTSAQGQKEKCYAVVKTKSDIAQDGNSSGAVGEYVIPSIANDPIKKLPRQRWTPRWKWVVKALRSRMAHDFEKDGTEQERVPEQEQEQETEPGAEAAADRGSQEEVEDTLMVYAGSIGQIIGPKGAKIKEIKEKTSVTSIDTPPKAEDGSRPRARDLVPITLKGTRYNIEQAKKQLQAVVDEWASNANVPRQPRTFVAEPQEELYRVPETNTAPGGWDNIGGGASASAELASWEENQEVKAKMPDWNAGGEAW